MSDVVDLAAMRQLRAFTGRLGDDHELSGVVDVRDQRAAAFHRALTEWVDATGPETEILAGRLRGAGLSPAEVDAVSDYLVAAVRERLSR